MGRAKLQVLGLDAGGVQLGARGGQHVGGVERAGRDVALGGAQRARQGGGALALGAGQVGVARAHRQPVGLADGRGDLDPDRACSGRATSLRMTSACWASFWPK